MQKKILVSVHKRFSFLSLILVLVHSDQAFAFQRIITLAPALSEWTALVLGEKATTTKLVGVSGYSLYPEQVKKIESIGPYHELNIEKIASLKPAKPSTQKNSTSSTPRFRKSSSTRPHSFAPSDSRI